MRAFTIVVLLTAMAYWTQAAQGSDPVAHRATQSSVEEQVVGHPNVPPDRAWTGVMVTIVLGMFVAAAAVGLTVRLHEVPEEEPADDHGDAHGGHGGH